MNRSWKKLVLGAGLVGALAAGVISVSAQETQATEEARPQRGLVRNLIGIVVDETGLQPREILSQIRDNPGTTLADVITSSGGSVDVVIDGAVAEITERVNARVADGTLTQEDADRILSRAEERITNGLNGEGPVRRFVEFRLRNTVLDLATEQTGLIREDIVAQVRAGATLADVLRANGVDVDTFIDTVVTQVNERLPERLSDERSAALLERLREQLTTRLTGAEA